MKPTRSPSSTTRAAIAQLEAGRGHRADSVIDLMADLRSARFEATGDPRPQGVGSEPKTPADTRRGLSKRSSLGR